jgi:hypothetical protein
MFGWKGSVSEWVYDKDGRLEEGFTGSVGWNQGYRFHDVC